ncbi:Protein of unknown function DUF2678 [Trypanosoma melophagium]|uniref:Protein of unknown function DUF2678 n=1 Tax=Trypanosoma melophagium TaxID=715481 RepID=UPI00351A6787|nr:Protein of unknown function DUF2678 [Trypanosoma melophagium]
MLNEHIDGLHEGHEPRSTRLLTRTLIIVYVIIFIVAIVLNIALVTQPGSHPSSIVNAVGIIVLVCLSLMRIKWYKSDHQEKKQKRAIYVLMFAVLLLCVAAFMITSDTLHYHEPLPCPETTTTTTTTTTPAPNSSDVNVF